MTNTVQTKANPKAGFWFCNFAFTLERFSYYSAKWLIIQFIAMVPMRFISPFSLPLPTWHHFSDLFFPTVSSVQSTSFQSEWL